MARSKAARRARERTGEREPEQPSEQPLGISPGSRRDLLAREPVVLTQAVRWTNRRRTRLAAALALIGGSAILAGLVLGETGPGGPTRVEQATSASWAATGALSDGLRALDRGDSLTPLRDEARAARAAVQEAGKATKALDLSGEQASVQRRTTRTLRAHDAWIDAIGSTLANPRSRRRADLSRLARTAAERTADTAREVRGAEGTIGGTGRLLAATERG